MHRTALHMKWLQRASVPGHQPYVDDCLQRAIYGNFSGPKAQEIIVSRGKVLELLRPDESGKMQTIVATEVFGQIRALVPFRLTGGNRDYIIVGSDSGRIVILEYSKEKNSFIKVGCNSEFSSKSQGACRRGQPGLRVDAGTEGDKNPSQVHQETFGKSGCRRIVPGEYLAVDPKGRACMIGAVEKQKLVRVIAWHALSTTILHERSVAVRHGYYMDAVSDSRLPYACRCMF